MIVTSSSPEFHCKEVELKDNEILYVPSTFLRSSRRSICILLCEGIVSKSFLAQHSLVLGLFFLIVQEIPTRLLDLLASPDFTSLLSVRKLQIAQYLGASETCFFPLGCNTVRLIILVVSYSKYSNCNVIVNFVMLYDINKMSITRHKCIVMSK